MKKRVFLFVGLFYIVAQPLVAQRPNDAVEVKVENLQATPLGVSVTLRAHNSRDRIQMMIGFPEGQSIALAMRHEKGPRPIAHDLFKDFLDRNGWQVQRVVIRALQGGTFLADLTLEKERETQVYDARPSDAMAIGLRYDAKIFVNKEVFEQQKQEEEREEVKPKEPDTLRL